VDTLCAVLEELGPIVSDSMQTTLGLAATVLINACELRSAVLTTDVPRPDSVIQQQIQHLFEEGTGSDTCRVGYALGKVASFLVASDRRIQRAEASLTLAEHIAADSLAGRKRIWREPGLAHAVALLALRQELTNMFDACGVDAARRREYAKEVEAGGAPLARLLIPSDPVVNALLKEKAR
jgi:hypothetical protein